MKYSTIVKLSALALAVLSVQGCISDPHWPADTRVTIAPAFDGEIVIADIRCVKDEGSCFYTFQANAVNTTSRELRVEWKVTWLDSNGVEIDSVLSTWNSLALQPREIRALKGIAPSTKAADMRIYVRPMK